MRFAPSLAVCFALLTTVPGAAQAGGMQIDQRLLTQDGWPHLVANHPDGGLATPSWKVCTDVCGPTVATGTSYQPGPTPAGTTFEAAVTYLGVTTTDRTPVWGGRATNTAPPTFSGEVKAGFTLTPIRGTWSGGWSDDVSLIGMQACPTQKVEGCKALTASSFQPGNSASVVLDSAYGGWYIGAVEQRAEANSAYTMPSYAFPPGQISRWSAPVPAQTVAAGALFGPVPETPKADPPNTQDPPTAADPPKAGGSSAVPAVKLRRRALRKRGTLVLGTLRCDGCAAAVTTKQGRRKATWSVIGSATGTLLQVNARRFPGASRLKVTVAVKDTAAQPVTGWIKLR